MRRHSLSGARASRDALALGLGSMSLFAGHTRRGSVISNCACSAASGLIIRSASALRARTRWHFATLMDGLIGAAAGVALLHTQIVAHIGMGMAWFCGVNFT